MIIESLHLALPLLPQALGLYVRLYLDNPKIGELLMIYSLLMLHNLRLL